MRMKKQKKFSNTLFLVLMICICVIIFKHLYVCILIGLTDVTHSGIRRWLDPEVTTMVSDPQ